MKIIFDDEYENVDKDISTMKKYLNTHNQQVTI